MRRILLIGILLLLPSFSYAGYDTFDTYSTGNVSSVTSNVWRGETGTNRPIITTNVNAVSSPNVLGATGSGFSGVVASTTAYSQVNQIDFYFRYENIFDSGLRINFRQSNGDNQGYLDWDSASRFCLNNYGGAVCLNEDIATSTTYHIFIRTEKNSSNETIYYAWFVNLTTGYTSSLSPVAKLQNSSSTPFTYFEFTIPLTGFYDNVNIYGLEVPSIPGGVTGSSTFPQTIWSLDYPSQDTITESENINFAWQFYNLYGVNYDQLRFQLQDLRNGFTIDTSEDFCTINASGWNNCTTETYALFENTPYMWRAYARDTSGTLPDIYSQWVTFSTLTNQFQSVVDWDYYLSSTTATTTPIPNFFASGTPLLTTMPQLDDILRTKFPFSYVYDFAIVLRELYPIGSPALGNIVIPHTIGGVTSTTTVFSVAWVSDIEALDQIKTYIRWLMWLIFAFYVVASIIGIKMQIDTADSVQAVRGASAVASYPRRYLS